MTLRNEPVQARSINRVESIKQAARAHYADVGRDNFNTADVAKLAGCSIGTVYRYFEDRVGLLDVVAPDRNAAADRLQAVRAILTRKLPMVGAEAEERRAELMAEALKLIDS